MPLRSYSKSQQLGKSTERICIFCGKGFVSNTHGGTKQFCSYKCSNTHKWKTRIRKPKPIELKRCVQCGKEYQRAFKYSRTQWNQKLFCTISCAAESRKINDGMTTHERSSRKRGVTKRGTPEFIQRMSATTKQGMMRPEVKEKLKKQRIPMSLERRIVHSNSLVGIMPKNLMGHGSYPNVQRGDYECSKGTVYFRSKWEANYALFLDFLIKTEEIINWEYEADTFFFEKIKLGTRSYRPDFKVFNHDGTVEYHEVKGYMDARSKTKLKRMEIYFPETTLILIERKYYMEMLKRLKGLIKFY